MLISYIGWGGAKVPNQTRDTAGDTLDIPGRYELIFLKTRMLEHFHITTDTFDAMQVVNIATGGGVG